jgi:L-threonylcarbamoyladenylate synthase
LPQVDLYPNAFYRALSDKGDLKQAARHLYQFLHELDQLELDMVIIERVENKNQGKALNDRINRASQPYPFNHQEK